MTTNDSHIDQDSVAGQAPQPLQDEKKEKGTPVWRRILKVLAWIVLTPLLLCVLLVVCLYLPPVQQWAVERASEMLSEETGLDVSVGSVSLTFPLDLELTDVVAVKNKETGEQADTVLNAGSMTASVQLKPLFRGEVEIDRVALDDVSINTINLIDAARVDGHFEHLGLEAHSVNLNTGIARLSHLELQDADLLIELADSVPEDTAVSEPLAWKILLDDVKAERIRLNVLLSPQSDSIYTGATIGLATLKGSIDLANAVYDLRDISIQQSAAHYADIRLDRLALDAPLVRMDSLTLQIPKVQIQANASDVQLAYKMDLTAFDSVSPGRFVLNVSSHLDKETINALARPYVGDMLEALPPQPLTFNMSADGNLNQLHITDAHAYIVDILSADLNATMENLTDTTGRQALAVDMLADLMDVRFIKEMLPADIRQSFMIPRNIKLGITARMKNGELTADGDARIGNTLLSVNGVVGMDDEDYAINVDISDGDVRQFVPLEESLDITGTLAAKGHGFDIFSPQATAQAHLVLDRATMGQMDLSNATADLSLRRRMLDCTLDCDNDKLKTRASVSGKLQTHAVDAHLDLDLAHADIQAMGFAENPFSVKTCGQFDLRSDLKKTFRIDADVDVIDLLMGTDAMQTNAFKLYAETQHDSTMATLSTGDLYFDFHAPYNLFSLTSKLERFTSIAAKQASTRELDVNALRTYLPRMQLTAYAGTDNPLSKILAVEGIGFNDLKANLTTTPETGIIGDAHVFALQMDTLRIDTIVFNVRQDSSQFVFHTGVTCDEQKMHPAFSAILDGYASTTDADAHLTYFEKRKGKGIDLGMHAMIGDSILDMKLYPKTPVLGFVRFDLNDDNYIRLGRKNRMFANIHLQSLEDSCRIHITSDPADSLRQDIRAVIQHLDLEQLLAAIPGMPSASGILNIDATYQHDFKRSSVKGMTDIDQLVYEGMPVGNIMAVFDYDPLGTDLHGIKARLSHDGQEVALLNGTYNATGDGYLDAQVDVTELPLSMASPFIPDQMAALGGLVSGTISVKGPTDRLDYNGELMPKGMVINSDIYSLALQCADEPVTISNSRIHFNRHSIYSKGTASRKKDDAPLTLNGWVDFSDIDDINMSLSLYGQDFELIGAPRTRKSVVFGNMYGDFYARVNGSLSNLYVRGLINVLGSTNMTYVMADTPLSIDSRLEDIVTFVDFNEPPDIDDERIKSTFLGMDVQVTLQVQDGAQFNCEFSADRQSYVNVQGSGSIVMNYTPEGVMTMQGRYTVNEGEMKYTLPVIPLKTFTINNGSYVEFTGEPMNPVLNISATEENKAIVNEGGTSSRSVLFKTGLAVTGTLENMELLFTIEAPEDLSVQNELAGMSKEEKNKLAVGMLTTGLYLSSSNSSGLIANNALNNFLQTEINGIAGKAFSSTDVNVNVGMEQTARDDGSTRTDYAFKFSKRFFSNRLNVIIGGKVNADGDTQENESGAYIDNVSLEWRLNAGGTRYVRLYHEKNYDNLIEGELTENGVAIVLRKKLDKLSDLIIWRKKDKQ